MVEAEQRREEAVEIWRELTEDALQLEFGTTNEEVVVFRGKLSTDPEKVHEDINENLLLFRCEQFSSELHESFSRMDVATEVRGSSANPSRAEHLYVTPQDNPHDIIIDPTIGQVIRGHNHVYVGTRADLKNLLHAQLRWNAQYKLGGYYGDKPEAIFQELWGEDSMPASEFANGSKDTSDIKSESFFMKLVRATPLLKSGK